MKFSPLPLTNKIYIGELYISCYVVLVKLIVSPFFLDITCDHFLVMEFASPAITWVISLSFIHDVMGYLLPIRCRSLGGEISHLPMRVVTTTVQTKICTGAGLKV